MHYEMRDERTVKSVSAMTGSAMFAKVYNY